MTVHTVFIGYDAREDVAYRVCRRSLLRHSTAPLNIRPLYQAALRRAGLYRRAPEAGTWTDSADGLPFSTEFTFTRFLVPALMQWEGWALFCDCDFLFTRDIAELFALADPKYALMRVPNHHSPTETLKMDGQQQTRYHGKNQSSLILWNCGHEAHEKLTIDTVNLSPGRWLHGFYWLRPEEIGTLPMEWNWLEGWSPKREDPPAGIHYTRGGPWFDAWRHVEYADLWLAERDLLIEKEEKWPNQPS